MLGVGVGSGLGGGTALQAPVVPDTWATESFTALRSRKSSFVAPAFRRLASSVEAPIATAPASANRMTMTTITPTRAWPRWLVSIRGIPIGAPRSRR